ncbi:hypothetical protein B0H13DRAFT_1870383 [Mycena leptocephala]|nr:hypothetical protein B0H13DRAFT_1870383 [Mycena leptocephala]
MPPSQQNILKVQKLLLPSRSRPVCLSTTKNSEGKDEQLGEKDEKSRSIVQIQTIWVVQENPEGMLLVWSVETGMATNSLAGVIAKLMTAILCSCLVPLLSPSSQILNGRNGLRESIKILELSTASLGQTATGRSRNLERGRSLKD